MLHLRQTRHHSRDNKIEFYLFHRLEMIRQHSNPWFYIFYFDWSIHHHHGILRHCLLQLFPSRHMVPHKSAGHPVQQCQASILQLPQLVLVHRLLSFYRPHMAALHPSCNTERGTVGRKKHRRSSTTTTCKDWIVLFSILVAHKHGEFGSLLKMDCTICPRPFTPVWSTAWGTAHVNVVVAS